MTLEDWKNLTQAIQSAVVVLAILIGGFWTVYTFSSQKDVQRAEIDLRRLQLEALKAEAELHSLAEAPIGIAIEASQLDTPSGESYFVHSIVTLTNSGKSPVLIPRSPFEFALLRIEYSESGQHTIAQVLGPEGILPSNKPKDPAPTGFIRIPAGASRTLEYLVACPRAGIYQAVYTVPQSPKDKQLYKDLIRSSGFKDSIGEGILWESRSFVIVR